MHTFTAQIEPRLATNEYDLHELVSRLDTCDRDFDKLDEMVSSTYAADIGLLKDKVNAANILTASQHSEITHSVRWVIEKLGAVEGSCNTLSAEVHDSLQIPACKVKNQISALRLSFTEIDGELEQLSGRVIAVEETCDVRLSQRLDIAEFDIVKLQQNGVDTFNATSRADGTRRWRGSW